MAGNGHMAALVADVKADDRHPSRRSTPLSLRNAGVVYFNVVGQRDPGFQCIGRFLEYSRSPRILEYSVAVNVKHVDRIRG